MAQYLHVHVGDYQGVEYDPCVLVIGQTIETGQQMVSMGENIGKMMLSCPSETLHLFTNNDHFLNGIRLACKKMRIDHTAVTIFEWKRAVVGLTVKNIIIDTNGRLSEWPKSFTAIEDALCQL